MNKVKKIIASIERNHAIMEAQVERLAELSPDPIIPNFGGTPNLANVSDLLNSTLFGQMQGAANALRALSEVQADFSSMTKENQRSLTDSKRSAEAINAEFTEIDTKEGI